MQRLLGTNKQFEKNDTANQCQQEFKLRSDSKDVCILKYTSIKLF